MSQEEGPGNTGGPPPACKIVLRLSLHEVILQREDMEGSVMTAASFNN